MAAASLVLLAEAALHQSDRSIVAFLGLCVGVVALAMGTRRLVLQVLGRAIAWLVLLPSALHLLLASQAQADIQPVAVGLLVTSGAALVLGSGALRSMEARATFHPLRFRAGFIAASELAFMATTLLTCACSALLAYGQEVLPAAALLALATGHGAAAVGVLRMRTWGVLLGAATGLASSAAMLGVGGGAFAALAAVPGLALALPIALARALPEARSTEYAREVHRIRIAIPAAEDVISGAGELGEVETLDDPPPAARAGVASRA